MRGWLAMAAIVATGCGSGPKASDGGDGHMPDFSHVSDLGQEPGDMAFAPGADLPPSGQCLGGHYVGTYEGMILIGGLVPVKTHGTVDLTLSQSGGEFFQIMDGHLMGMASKNPYSSDLVGMLNCATLKLEGGMLKNGKVTISGITYMFEGPLTADYDPKTVSFVNGAWNIKQVPTPSSTGSGTWTATHM